MDASQAVTLMRCALTGGPGADTWLVPFPVNSDPSPGGPAAQVEASDVALWQCTLTGGRGGRDDFHGNPGENGAEALLAQGSVVFLSGCLLTGGAGADDCDLPTPDLCAGGDGLVLDSARSAVQVDSTFAGGQRGVLSGGGQGLPGVDLSAAPGSLSLAIPGVARGLAATAVARELQPAAITYQGSTGDFLGLFLSLDSLFVPQYFKAGIFHLGSPPLGPTVLAPVTAPSGALTIDFTAWDLTGLPLEGLTVCWQALVQAVGGGLRLSAPITLTVVDDSL